MQLASSSRNAAFNVHVYNNFSHYYTIKPIMLLHVQIDGYIAFYGQRSSNHHTGDHDTITLMNSSQRGDKVPHRSHE